MAVLYTYALTTVADVKETLGLSSGDSSKNNLIIRKINQATDIIENYCERRFVSTVYTNELYDGSGDQELVLRQRPIISVATVEVRNTVLNATDFTTIPTDQYFIDNNAGILRAVTNFWGHYDMWRINYTAGYATIPTDLAEACATLAAYLTTHSVPGLVEQVIREGQREVRYQQKPAVTNIYDLIGIKDTLDNYADTVVYGGR